MARRPPAGHPSPRPGRPAAGEAAPAPVWEALFHSASAAQRSEWLALAERQGVLYTHQLPPHANGDAADRCRHTLALILGGKADELDPVPDAEVTPPDRELDPVQRAAVARALATPDFFLLQGFAGTGKSRVAAEVVSRAVARGERVLLLAPTSAAIDRVLELAEARTPVSGLRCLGREERVESLPPLSRSLTLAEHARHLQEHTLPKARHELELRENALIRRRQDEARLPRLQDLAAKLADLGNQIDGLAKRRTDLPLQLERESAEPGDVKKGSFVAAVRSAAQAFDETRLRLDASLAELQAKRIQQQQQLATLASQTAVLRPLAEARRQGRWWTGTWWRALSKRGLFADLANLDARHQQAQTVLGELNRETERLEKELRDASAAHESQRARVLAEETRRRQEEIELQIGSLRRRGDALRQEWQKRRAELDPGTSPPADASPEAVRQAMDAWRRQLEQDEESVVFARDWLVCLEQTAHNVAERLPGQVSLVAAPLTALPVDPLFGDGSGHGSGFDLLVLGEADLVTESEFLALARRARRWILVGEPIWEVNGNSSARSATARAPRPPHPADPRAALHTPSLGFFHRLWEQLHCDPRRLPYTWARDEGGLCCRLCPVAPEQRRWLESERVVDFPDIELRILTLPDTPPRLAEVIFPPTMSVVEAKEYIYRELQELPVRASCPAVYWSEEPDRIILGLADAPIADTVSVALEAGVREFVAAGRLATDGRPELPSWETCRIEFDRSLGWQRHRAEEWAREHLGVRDLGRTAWLRTPHRTDPDLAAFLSDVIFNGGYCLPSVSSADRAAARATSPVEFIPVPAPPKTSRPQAAGARHPAANGSPRVRTAAPPRGGAGLELDPADARHPDRLPDDLRQGLPNRGLVNYLEARAVAHAVEAFVCDARPHNPGRPDSPRRVLAVIALYAAQAELIRRLLAHSPAVAASGVAVEIGTPADFRERECQAVFVSLTRSHTHRAVAYGDDPRLLALALTRARCRLTLFGDPGTLLRRAQWQGPLEHLDETAAARERTLLEALARYLQGQGRCPGVFHVREGGGP